MTNEQPEQNAWEDRCRDCDDTGITIQTERRCACQPPLRAEQPEQWAVELLEAVHDASDVGTACGMVDCPQCAKAALVLQRAFTERTADLVAREKRARDLSIVIVKHIGGGSEWFSQIGDEFYTDPAIIDGELQRRKTDAQITKKALIRANRENADLVADNAKLREENQRIRKMLVPEWFYQNGYGSEDCQDSPDEVVENMDLKPGRHIVSIDCAGPMPSIWCIVHVRTDEEMDALETDDRVELIEHASEDAARQALAQQDTTDAS